VTFTDTTRAPALTVPVAIGVGATFREAEADALCGLAKLVVTCVDEGATPRAVVAPGAAILRARLGQETTRREIMKGASTELRKLSPTRLSDDDVRFLEQVVPGWNAPVKGQPPSSVWLTATIEGTRNQLTLRAQGCELLRVNDGFIRKHLGQIDWEKLQRALQTGEPVYCMAKVNMAGTAILEISDVTIPEVAEVASDTKLAVAGSIRS
jgi:hypothetical protein